MRYNILFVFLTIKLGYNVISGRTLLILDKNILRKDNTGTSGERTPLSRRTSDSNNIFAKPLKFLEQVVDLLKGEKDTDLTSIENDLKNISLSTAWHTFHDKGRHIREISKLKGKSVNQITSNVENFAKGLEGGKFKHLISLRNSEPRRLRTVLQSLRPQRRAQFKVINWGKVIKSVHGNLFRDGLRAGRLARYRHNKVDDNDLPTTYKLPDNVEDYDWVDEVVATLIKMKHTGEAKKLGPLVKVSRYLQSIDIITAMKLLRLTMRGLEFDSDMLKKEAKLTSEEMEDLQQYLEEAKKVEIRSSMMKFKLPTLF